LLGDERVDPVAGDDHAGGQVAVGTVGSHPDDRAVGPVAVTQQTGHGGRRDQGGAGGHGVLCQPGVEVGSVGGRAVVGRLAPGAAAVVDGQRPVLGEDHGGAAGHPALHGGLGPPLGDDLVEDASVDDAAV